MSFTDQLPFVATEEHLSLKWGGAPAAKKFRCAWCGHTFQAGDTVRWVYTNSEPAEHHVYGNPFICASCDGPRDVILATLRERAQEFKSKYWWFER